MWLIECPNDDQGLLRPLVTIDGNVVMLCDSGGEVWLDPQDISLEAMRVPQAPEWWVQGSIHVLPGTTRWASEADIPDQWREGVSWNDG